MIHRAFAEQLHPRGTGAQGGQFVAGGSGGAVKKAPAKKAAAGMSFDGKRGTGYGVKGGDKRVRLLQQALNRLGLTDGAGNKLVVDGKLGPRTTAAIKKAQRQLGLKPDGVVTPALLKQISGSKKLSKAKAKPAKKVAPAKKAAPARTPAPRPDRSGKGGEKRAPVVIAKRSVSYSERMADFLERHGTHNQKSHGNRLGKPTNVGGKTGLAKATAEVQKRPEEGPARAAKAREFHTYAQRREAVREHYPMTRDEFDKLPEDKKQAILDELREISGSGDQHTSRDGMGIAIRGSADHVVKAKELVTRFTRERIQAPDNSVQGRSARLLAANTWGEARAALYGATKAEMQDIAAMNGEGLNGWRGGTSGSWKSDKWRDYLIGKALESKGRT